MTCADLPTFLVETYVPRLDGAAAAAISAQYRTAIGELANEGIPIHWLRSYAAIEDETYVCVVAARGADDIALLGTRTRLSPDHVVEVVDVADD